jgi:hypothetical protein
MISFIEDRCNEDKLKGSEERERDVVINIEDDEQFRVRVHT